MNCLRSGWMLPNPRRKKRNCSLRRTVERIADLSQNAVQISSQLLDIGVRNQGAADSLKQKIQRLTIQVEHAIQAA